MNKVELKELLEAIAGIMRDNAEHLSELDARNGDGDLGLTMRDAFAAAAMAAGEDETADLGKTMMQCAMSVNAAAPSTSGTILSFWFMGAARPLHGKQEATLPEFAQALEAGIQNICEKAKSNVGDKTILDAISPAVDILIQHADSGTAAATKAALDAAQKGMESTKDMLPKHGRATYYGEKLLGLVDGGAVAGKLIFEGAYRHYRK